MIFIINNLKYNTKNMKLISEKCECQYPSKLFEYILFRGQDVKLWKSKKGNWLLTYRTEYGVMAKALNEKEAKTMLLKYDYETYEKLFGDIEEA